MSTTAVQQSTPRYTKLDAAGQPLPDDAGDWSAVHDRSTGLIYPAELPTAKKPWRQRASILHGYACAGFTDWRVANDHEALSIIDRSRYSPAVDTRYFRFPESGWIWTDTPWAADPESGAWNVSLGSGDAYDDPQNSKGLVLPVRGPVPSPGQS